MKKSFVNYRWCIFLCAACIIVLRAPSLFSEPRFWCEEGTVFYAYAATHEWFEVLFRTHYDYLYGYLNLSSFLASRLVSLEYAPLVTTFMAFLAQLLPISIIIWGTSSVWNRPLKKIIAVMLVLFIPLTGEMWLNTLNSKTFFSLTIFLILLEDMDNASRVRTWFYRLLLLISGLASIECSFYLVVYLLKIWIERKKEYVIQTTFLLLSVIYQALGYFHILMPAGERSLHTLQWIPVTILGGLMWRHHLVLPILGASASHHFGRSLLSLHDRNPLLFNAIGVVLFVMLVLLFVYFSRHLTPCKRLLFPASFVVVGFLTYMSMVIQPTIFEAFITGLCQRYFWVPSLIVLFMIFANLSFLDRPLSLSMPMRMTIGGVFALLYATAFFYQQTYALRYYLVPAFIIVSIGVSTLVFSKTPHISFREKIGAWLLLIVLINGIFFYRQYLYRPYPWKVIDATWPKWKEEVAQWRDDPTHVMKIWPPCCWEIKFLPESIRRDE